MVASGLGLLMALIAGGGGNDLLDYVQSKAYWDLQKTPVTVAAMTEQLQWPKTEDIAALVADLSGQDAAKREAASGKLRAMGEAALPELEKVTPGKTPDEKDLRIGELIGQIGQRRRVQAVRRLMAIRALGELKDAAAAPVLRGLLASPAPFEADYARAAMAAIEGKAYARPATPAKTFTGEAWLLPAGCAAAAQARLPSGAPVDFAKAMEFLPADTRKEASLEKILPPLTKMILEAAERVGNVRLDGVTMGFSADLGARVEGKDRGWVVLIGRGLYDVAAVRALLAKAGPESKDECVDGVPVVRVSNEFFLVLPSDSCLAIVAGPESQEKAPVIKELIAAFKAGKGALAAASPLGALIGSLDTSRPAWGAMVVNENYRQTELLAPFDTVTLLLDPAKQAANVTLTAQGKDAEKVAATVAKFQADLAKA
jgi:hypothetical protein